MRAFIQCNSRMMPFNETVYNAFLGFQELGTETIFFRRAAELVDTTKEDIIVGGLQPTKWKLEQLGCTYPELDYPEELAGFMGRKIWRSKINTINSSPELWPVFVKPYIDKKFAGRVINSPSDLVGCGSCYEDYDVICSEVISLKAEWRVFVRYGKILDVRRYTGDWRVHYEPEIIEKCIESYNSQPAAFAIDFGVTDKGKTVLIEVNDGFSIGAYGLFHIDYAKMLATRWSELTGIEDEYDFMNEREPWYRTYKKE